MADIYKTAIQAGREARSRGQTGMNPEDASLRAMATQIREGASTISGPVGAPSAPAVRPRRAAIAQPVASPTPQEDPLEAIWRQNTATGYEDLVPREPSQGESKGSLLGDVGRSLAGGAVNLGGGIYELGNMATRGALDSGTKSLFGTSGTEAISGARQALRGGESSELQAQRKELEEADGFFDSFKTIITNPRLAGAMTLEMVPQLLTVAGAARLAATKTLAGAAKAGMTAEAANAAAATNATRTVLGLNAAMEGGAAGSDARQSIMTMSEAELDQSPQYQALVRQYGDNPQGRAEARTRLANDASMFSTAIAGGISLLSNKLTGAGKLEADVLTRGIGAEAGEQATKRTALGVVKDIAKAGAKEVPQESIEEGGSQFATNVGVKYSGAKPDQDLTEGVPEAAGAGGALGLIAGAGFGTLNTAKGAREEQKAQEAPAAPNAPAAQDVRTLMSDAEYGAAINNQPYMAAAYARADEAGRARLRAANPGMDFDALLNDEKAQKIGSSLIDNNPVFFDAFNARLPQVQTEQQTQEQSDSAPFDGATTMDAPPDFVPTRERMRIASELAAEGIDEAEGRFTRSKPVAQPDPDSLNAGPAIQIPGLPSQDVLIRGYQRRAENLASMPEGARAAAAQSSMQEMISRGFTPEQAQSVFGSILNPQESESVVEDEAPPQTLDLSNPELRPKIDPNFQTFAQVRERMAERDMKREPSAKPTDYLETPVPAPIRELAKRFGVQVFGFKYIGKNPILKSRNGASLSGGAILLNSEAQSQHLSVFGHELYHELRRRDPQAAAQLEQEILSYVSQPGKDELRQRLLKVGYDVSKIDEEMTADLMGVMFTEPQFWAELGQNQPSLLKRILQVLDEMLAKFGDLGNRKSQISAYVTDMEKVRQMLVGFVNESQGGTEAQSEAIDDSFDLTPEQEDALGKAGKLGSMNRVVSLVMKGNVQEAAKLFKDSDLRGTAGVSFSDVIRDVEGRLFSDQPTLDFVSDEDRKVMRQMERMQNAQAAPEAQIEERNPNQGQFSFLSPEEQEVALAFEQRFAESKKAQEAVQKAEPKEAKQAGAPAAESRLAQMAQEIAKNPTPDVLRTNGMKFANELRQFARQMEAASSSKNELQFKQMAEAKFAAVLRKMGDRRAVKPVPIFDIVSDGQTIGRIFDIGPRGGANRFGMVTINKSGNLDWALASSSQGLVNRGSKMGEVTPTGKSVAERGELDLKRDITKYDTEVMDIMSGLTKRTRTRLNERMQRDQKTEQDEDDDVTIERKNSETGEFEAFKRDVSLLENDQGGVFGNMALSGVYGKEGFAEAESRKQTAEERARDQARDERERAAIMISRVRNLLNNVDKQLNLLQGVRERMAKEGFTDSQIQATVGKAESDLKALRDTDLAQFVREGFKEIDSAIEQNEPEEFAGSDEMQAELEFNDRQRTEARRLVEAIANKEMAFDEALDQVRKNEIGLMHLYDAMREAGMEISKERIDISGNVAVNYTLNDYVSKFPTAGLAARDAWLRAYDNLRIKGAVKLTAGEEVAYNEWKKENNALKRRLKERIASKTEDGDMNLFAMMEDAFPHALFLNYTLNEMRDVSKIDEPRQSMIKAMFDDPVRAWMKDIDFVLSARPDLRPQLDNYLTKSEMEAYQKFSEREVREARRELDMKMRSPAYSQLDSLRYLSPDLYMNYRQEIAQAEQEQLSVILQSALEQNDLARAAKEAGEDIGLTIEDYLNQAAQNDEQRSKSPDEMDDDIDTPRFRRGVYSGALPAMAVQAHFEGIFAKWDTPPAYTVVQNPNQLPDDVRNRLTSRFANNDFRGAIDPKTGHIYVFSDFVDSTQDAEVTMFHELYGHWGMRAFLGDSINSFLKNQYRLNEDVRKEADRQREQAKQDGMPMTELESIEEAIADLAANGKDAPFIEMIGRLVRWLRKHGMETVADWIDSNGSSELAFMMAQARKVAMSKQGISPLAGAPSQAMYSRKKMPVEMFAIRDGKTTAYARINPVTQQWTVFTLNDPGQPLSQLNFSAESVDEAADAHNLLKKFGSVTLSRDRGTRQEVDPNDFSQIPDFKDLTGWAKMKRNATIQFQNMFLPIFEVARFLESKGIKNTVIDDLIKYESRLQYYVDDYTRRFAVPIQQALKAIGEKGATIEDVDLFLMARHAKERNEVIKAINPKNTKGSGLSTQEAQKILKSNNDGKWVSFSKELDQLGALMDQMSKDKLAYMLNTGLINKYQYESLSRYDHYVNLSGNKELGLDEYDGSELGGRAFNVAGNDVIRATGRGTQAVDVLQNTMNSYLSVLIRGQKNKPLQAMLKMFEQNPDATYVQMEKISTKKRINVEKFNFDKKILRAIATEKATEKEGGNFLTGLKQRMERGEIDSDEALSELVSRIRLAEERRDITPDEAARAIRSINEQVVIEARLSPDGYVSTIEDTNPRKNEVIVKVNGAPVKMAFTGRGIEFFQAITGMNIQQAGAFTEAIGAWNRLFSQMVTTWNPAWVPVNALRDIQTAFANAAADPEVGAELAGQMLTKWKRMHKVAFRHLVADQANEKQGFWGSFLKGKAKKNPLTAEEKALIDEFFKEGAGTFFLDRVGLEQTLDKLNRSMNPAKLTGGVKEAAQWTEDKLSGVADMMELFTMPVEIAPRLAAYQVMRDHYMSQGMDAAEARSKAARYAKELTVNFNMKGASKQFRALYVFANPAIQGTVRMFADLKKGNLTRFGTVAGTWMMLGIVGNMIARALGDDDEEKPGIDKLDMVPNYRRATQFIFAPDTYGGAIPVAYGWNVFMAAGHYLYDSMFGYLKPGEAAQRVMTAAFDSFAPIGSGAESESFAGMALKTAAPSPIVPIVEFFGNENRFGAPIYKEQSPFSNVKETDAYMHFNSVNPISKWAMQSLASATSGGKNPRYNEALIDVNPASVDHFIGNYLPGLFSEAYKGAGVAITAAQGRNTKEMDLPLVSRLRAKVDEESFDAGAFRRVQAVADTKYKEYMAPDTPAERKREILKDYPNIGGIKAMFSGTEQQIKSMRQTLEAVERNPAYPDEQKVAQRNRIEKMEEEYRRRAVREALKRGFRDAVIDNSPT